MATIPPRFPDLLFDALDSVGAQTRRPDAIVVVIDKKGKGDISTRHQALLHVETEWTAFFDDDDEMLENHLEDLLGAAKVCSSEGYEIGFVSSRTPGLWDTMAHNITHPHCLVRTWLLRQSIADGYWGCLTGDWTHPWAICEQKGLRRVHVTKKTWRWYDHTSDGPGKGNTAGLSWTDPAAIAHFRELRRQSSAAAMRYWRERQVAASPCSPDRPETIPFSDPLWRAKGDRL